jgi:hypothetical protein
MIAVDGGQIGIHEDRGDSAQPAKAIADTRIARIAALKFGPAIPAL